MTQLAHAGIGDAPKSLGSDVMRAVENALTPQAGLTPKQVHFRVDCWSRGSVCRALRQLVLSGRATYVGEIGHRRYRRAP